MAWTVGLAALIGSLIPLLPFIFLSHNLAFLMAIAISGLALFAIGAYQAVSLVGNWKRSGIQMVVIGIGAAIIGFLIARLFNVSG
ncbi:MAG: VIT1/CCC1 transporter family protein [bacterium]|nr:VIT1/CCC1 transporter family protein [bacterium]